MLLFDTKAFGHNDQGIEKALTEAHAEIGDLRRSLRDALAHATLLATRCTLLEQQLRRRR